jgi:hypothetical protein
VKLKKVTHNGEVLAVHVPGNYRYDGLEFVTDPSLPLQVGMMRYPAGRVIEAHYHPPEVHTVRGTPEAIEVRKGKVRADIYTVAGELVESVVVSAGDAIILVAGGHGFEVLEEAEMVEFKIGPYLGDADKVRFGG